MGIHNAILPTMTTMTNTSDSKKEEEDHVDHSCFRRPVECTVCRRRRRRPHGDHDNSKSGDYDDDDTTAAAFKLEEEVVRFRVTRSRGSTLASGGFGYFLRNNKAHSLSSTTTAAATANTPENNREKASAAPLPIDPVVAAALGDLNQGKRPERDGDKVKSSFLVASQQHPAAICTAKKRRRGNDNESDVTTKIAAATTTTTTTETGDSAGRVSDNVSVDDDDDFLVGDESLLQENGGDLQPCQQQQQQQLSTQPTMESVHYLFLEEVLFLYKRGLLNVFEESDEPIESSSSSNVVAQQQTKSALTLADLYKFVWMGMDNNGYSTGSSNTASTARQQQQQHQQVSLAAYLVYQHVRAQTYRVVRHSDTRFKILSDMLALEKNNAGCSCSPENAAATTTTTAAADVDECESSSPRTTDKTSDYPRNSSLSSTLCNESAEAASDLKRERQPNHVPPDKQRIMIHTDDPTTSTTQCHSDAPPAPFIAGTANNGNDSGHCTLCSWQQRLKLSALKRLLRQDAAATPPPAVHATTTTSTFIKGENTMTSFPSIAYDCYHPDSTFSSSNPGLPDFYVAITYYNNNFSSINTYNSSSSKEEETDGSISERLPSQPARISFDDLRSLLQMASQRVPVGSAEAHTTATAATTVPLKIATVSDSGTVVMFGLTDYGVPSLTTTKTTIGKEEEENATIDDMNPDVE